MMLLPSTFPGPTGPIITIIQLLVTATSYSSEAKAETRAQYSKFSRASGKERGKATWSSRTAMMVIYTPALVVSSLFFLLGLRDGAEGTPGLPFSIPAPSLAAFLCILHFTKRCLEVLFLHQYSGRTDRGTPTMIGVFYSVNALVFAYGGGQSTPELMPVSNSMHIGTLLFLIGILGNLYHHYLLAKLRNLSKGVSSSGSSSKPNKKYVAPKGGLFSYVATPHYLFELIGWLGIAIVANHLNAYLAVAGMSSYLAGRSVAQNEFNRSEFDEKDWPRDRKNLIPFVF